MGGVRRKVGRAVEVTGGLIGSAGQDVELAQAMVHGAQGAVQLDRPAIGFDRRAVQSLAVIGAAEGRMGARGVGP